MSNTTFMKSALASACLLGAVTANAALSSVMGGKVVNDTDLNISWLADANLPATNTFGVGSIGATGAMDGFNVYNWINAMNAANYLGFNNWRLPSTTDIGGSGCPSLTTFSGGTCGYNVDPNTSEMAHLFYIELGNNASFDTAGHPQSGGLVNSGPFSNFQTGAYYHSSLVAGNASAEWRFSFRDGLQTADLRGFNLYTMVVRDGQVSAVPEPVEAWMFEAGLLVLVGVARKRKSAQ